VRFVGHHDDVRPVRQLGILLPLLGTELLDEREKIPVILAKELF